MNYESRSGSSGYKPNSKNRIIYRNAHRKEQITLKICSTELDQMIDNRIWSS